MVVTAARVATSHFRFLGAKARWGGRPCQYGKSQEIVILSDLFASRKPLKKLKKYSKQLKNQGLARVVMPNELPQLKPIQPHHNLTNVPIRAGETSGFYKYQCSPNHSFDENCLISSGSIGSINKFPTSRSNHKNCWFVMYSSSSHAQQEWHLYEVPRMSSEPIEIYWNSESVRKEPIWVTEPQVSNLTWGWELLQEL